MCAEGIVHTKVGEELAQVSETEREVGVQCGESVREDEQSKIIVDQNGSPDMQQDEVIGQLVQEIGVIDLTDQHLQFGQKYQENDCPITASFCSSGERRCEVTEIKMVEVTDLHLQHGQQSQEQIEQEQSSLVVDYQNGSPEPQYEQQDVVNGEKSQNQMQVTEETCKVIEEARIEVTEQRRECGPQSQEPSLEEQHGKMVDDENGSPIEQQGEVDGHQILIQLQEFIVATQNVAPEKYELAEQQTEHGRQSQEPIQEHNSKVLDYQNGLSKQQNEQKYEVNGQKSQNQILVNTEIVENHNVAEQTYEVTEQQRDHEQQSQEEQNRKVIDCQAGSPEQQNEHIDGIKRQIQFQEEVVEVINNLTRPEAHQIENVSELQEQIDLLRKIFNSGLAIFSLCVILVGLFVIFYVTLSHFLNSSIHESFSKTQEKAEAIAVNSNPPLTSQKLRYHGSSTFSRENCVELLRMTHKLQEQTHKVQESLLDLLTTRELSQTTPKPILDLEESLLEKRQKLKRSAEETGQTQLQQRQLRLRRKILSGSMTESLPSENHYEQPQERKHQSPGGRTKLNSHNKHNGELQPPKHPQKPQKPRGRPPKRKLNAAATEDLSLPAKYQKLQEEPEYQRQGRLPRLHAKIVLGLLAASQYEPALSMTKSPLLKLNPANEHDDELQPPKNPEQSQRRRGRPRKLNLDNELVKNCSPQSNLSSHKSEGEEPPKFNPDNEHHDDLQAPRLPEQPTKQRGRPRKLNPDNELVKNCSPQSNLSSHKSEGVEPSKFNPDNEHHDDLQAPRFPEQPTKQRGRPRKLNPDNELVKNCNPQSSHKSGEEWPPKMNPDNEHHDELLPPKQPEQPQSPKRRGRPRKLISENELKQEKSQRGKRHSKRLQEATMVVVGS